MTIIDAAASPEPSPDVARDLYDEALGSARRSVAVRLLIAGVVAPLCVAIAIADPHSRITVGGLLFPLVVWVGSSVQELRRLRRSTPAEAFRLDRDEAIEAARFRTEHALRLAGVKAWVTYTLAATLALVFAAEVWAGSIATVVASAGLVPSAVRAGEWWRLVTASCLHANVEHLVSNLAALLVLGVLIEAYDRRLCVPLVYLAAVAGGSLASLALSDKSGIGASGGIVGLAGYLLVRALQGRIPGPIRQSLLLLLAGIAFIGAIGYEFIGNAAHAGGAATGALVAWTTASEGSQSPDSALDALGWGAAAILIVGAVFTVSRLLSVA